MEDDLPAAWQRLGEKLDETAEELRHLIGTVSTQLAYIEELELTRVVGHLILCVAQGKECRDGSFIEVSGGVPV